MARSDCTDPRQRGLTLVELLISLTVASILALVVMITFSFSYSSSQNSGELTRTNDGTRTALTLLQRDIASAGFMFGAAQSQCSKTLAYDNGKYITYYPAWAANQASGTALPLGGGNANYPASGSANKTHALMLVSTPSMSTYGSTQAPPLNMSPVPVSGWSNGLSGGTLVFNPNAYSASLVLPATGDTAMVQVPLNGVLVCMRVPVVSTTTNTVTTTPSTYMPSNAFSDYKTQLAGIGNLTLSNLQYSSRLVDLGSSAQTMQAVQYWIDSSNGYPVLERATFSAIDETQIGSTQSIAPGVVSLQVLFGTVPSNAAAGTAPTFKSWSNVNVTTSPVDQVVSVALALVTRTLHDDRSYTAPSSITIPQPASGLSSANSFTSYTVPTAEAHRHFTVTTSIIALRNTTWQ